MTAAEKLEYCWVFLHPKHGWIGGTADDKWGGLLATESSAGISDAKEREYPIKILSRPVRNKAMPGSVRPSIRK